MARLLPFLAAGLTAAALVGAPALAQSDSMRAEFAISFKSAETVIISGRTWSCSANACVSRGVDPRPAVACRKLSRKIGQPVTRFTASQVEQSAADLASCNQDHE